MKMLSKKSTLLFGVVLAVCAFAVPMASAASFSTVGTTAQLTTNDLQFSQSIGGGLSIGSTCTTSQFDADVTSAALITITGSRFDNCRGTGVAAGCTVTETGTRFPWSMTAPTTASLQIHNIYVDVRVETAPGGAACNGLVHNINLTLTGTLTSGVFDSSPVGVNRRVTFVNASGLAGHSPFANGLPILLSFSLRDPSGQLNVVD